MSGIASKTPKPPPVTHLLQEASHVVLKVMIDGVKSDLVG